MRLTREAHEQQGGAHSMSRRKITVLSAVGATAALALAACSGGSSTTTGGGGSSGASGCNAAVNCGLNPSSHNDGQILYHYNNEPHSPHTRNTYYELKLPFTKRQSTPRN